MAISILTTQQTIIDLLKATTIPNVFEIAVPAGFKLPKQNNQFLPYITISFGGQPSVANRHQGIVSSKVDLKVMTVAIEVIGASGYDTRAVAQIVRDTLEGYQPAECGELSEVLSGDYTTRDPEYDLWPVRYATGMVYTMLVNTAASL